MTALVAVIGLIAAHRLEPPAALSSSAPESEASAGRAAEWVKMLAAQPRPAGSSEVARARSALAERLRSLGLEVRSQEGTVGGVALSNLLAVLAGRTSTGNVLLVAHIDSRPNAPGAADDAAGVAAILETLRALRLGPPLRNDLHVLLTDGEELGMLGARLFVERGEGPPPATTVAVNLEARGTCGASILFETSSKNGRFLSGALRALPHPVASSLGSSVYQLLPNDTDLTVLKEAGYAGLNFAFIDGVRRYHTPADSAEALDLRSLQHHCENALALVRFLGDLEEPARRAPDRVHGNLWGRTTFQLDARWMLPLTGVVTAAAAFAWQLDRWRGDATARGTLEAAKHTARGTLKAIFCLATPCGLASWAMNGFGSQAGALPWSGFPLNAAAAWGFAFGAWGFLIQERRHAGLEVPAGDLRAGTALCVLVPLWAAALVAPGAVPTFLVPLASGLAGRPLLGPGGRTRPGLLGAAALSVPGALILGPTIYLVFVGMSHSAFLAPAAAVLLGSLWACTSPWLLESWIFERKPRQLASG